jgi:hypothetical protein
MINSVGAGKGSVPRAVDTETYRSNYDNIFKKNTEASAMDVREELQAKFDAAVAKRDTAEMAYYWALLTETTESEP